MPRKKTTKQRSKNCSQASEQNAAAKSQKERRLKKAEKIEKDTKNGKEEKEEDEGNISKLDYELSSYGDLLMKALNPARGQKQLLKRLCADSDEVVEKCTVNELRRAVYEPSFIASSEGRKLAAHFIPKIGVDRFWILVKRVVTFESTNKTQCAHYGEVLLLGWKNSMKDGDERLSQRLERIFMDIVYYALQHLRSNKKFMAMLEPLGKARSKQVDAMIYRIFQPNLWRCLKAANESVRYNACCLFLPFYPFVSDDDIENAESINMQQGIIMDLLKDDSNGIRAEACRRSLFILGTYYDTFPLDFIKQCLTQIIDVLSVDSIVSVRVAVYEGMRDLLHCASALNACERALKCLFDNKGINDRSDHVRLAAFQLLNALMGHRFIKLSEVVKMDCILKIYAIEEFDAVRKEVTKLLLPSYMKAGLSPDEVIRRIIVMGQASEAAALSFHHIIVAENMITVQRAVQHAKSLVLAVYKALRSLEGIESSDTDEIVSICSESATCEAFIEPDKDEKSEKAEVWQSSCLLLNCLAVMWLPLRLILDDEKYAKENERLRRILTKLFKFAFFRYRNTSIMEALMLLGKTLDDWKEVKVLVLQELFQGCSLDDRKATMYLEAAVSWDFLPLLKFIGDAFDNMKRELSECSPPRKREKRPRLPDDSFNRSLTYLFCILKHPEMKHNLEQNYAAFVTKYCKDLSSLKQLTMEKIQQKIFRFSTFTLTFENIVRGIRMHYILAVMILTRNKKSNREEEELLKSMQGDVKWLKESLMPEFFMDITDGQLDMMVKICEMYMNLWTQQLRTYDTPIAFRAELCDAEWINMMKKCGGCVALLTTVLEMFKNLVITTAAKNELEEVPVKSLLVPIVKYVIRCSKSEFTNFDCKKMAVAWLSVYHTLKNCKLLTTEELAMQAKIIGDLVFEELHKAIKKIRHIQSPFEFRCFELSELANFWLKKILMRNRFLRGSVLIYLRDQIESRSLFKSAVCEDEIFAYGAVMQFLLILRGSSRKVSAASFNKSPRKNEDTYEACKSLLKEQYKEVVRRFRVGFIYTDLCQFIWQLREVFNEL